MSWIIYNITYRLMIALLNNKHYIILSTKEHVCIELSIFNKHNVHFGNIRAKKLITTP